MNNKDKGNIGELISQKYLENINYKVININYRNNFGEIDIIAFDDEILVFIEVKTRLSLSYGYPREAVDKNKMNRILKTSKSFIYLNNLNNYNVRYDVIEVYLRDRKYNHIKDAFRDESNF